MRVLLRIITNSLLLMALRSSPVGIFEEMLPVSLVVLTLIIGLRFRRVTVVYSYCKSVCGAARSLPKRFLQPRAILLVDSLVAITPGVRNR